MAVGSGTPYNIHIGNGVSRTFGYGFTLLDADDLVVAIDGVATSAYTVTGLGVAAGGTVVFSTAPASGAKIILQRVIQLVRATDYQDDGDLLADTLNDDFNRLWMAIQGVSAGDARSIRAPFPEVLNDLPAAADRADKILTFNSSGQPILTTPVAGTAGALATDLASSASATKGAGMVGGPDARKNYAVGTLGWWSVKDSINVMTFALGESAKNDGTTDDTVAIRAAIALAKAQKRDLFYPNGGGYRITSSILLDDSDYTTWFGEGGHYTASTILVDFDGPGLYGEPGKNITNGFRNLVFRCANQAAYPNSYGIKIDGLSVEAFYERISFRDFGNTGAYLNGSFGVRLDHCLFAGNGQQGLQMAGGSGSTLQAPIFQDNLGTALNIGGSGHSVLGGFWENNCKKNDPATTNGNFREIFCSDSNTVFVGGTLNCYPQNNKYPIEVTGQEVTFANVNPYSLGTGAPAWILVNGSFASVIRIGCRSLTIAGTTTNCVEIRSGSPGFFRPDVIIGNRSVSDGSAKAFANFDGTLSGTITAREASGVTNITKTATGSYTVNFSFALDTTTYIVSCSISGMTAGAFATIKTTAKTTTALSFQVINSAGTVVDASDINVVVHGVRST